MPVVEVFLGAFFSVLLDRLMSSELLKLAREEGFISKLRKLEKTLNMIQEFLIDAEEKQLTSKAVKLWLDDLRDLAYDVEDILDEFATENLGRKLTAENQASCNKAQKFLPVCFTGLTPSAVKFSNSMGSKIKDITSRLEELREQREVLGLKEISKGTNTAAAYQRPPSTSVQIEPAVYGRDEDKAKILEMVLKDEPSRANFRVISVVGMGGIGKTTLARLVFNEKAMEDFDPRGWVCVSDDFDVLKISNAILGSFTSSSCNLNDLSLVQIRLKEHVAGKKFLLVLDDVWSKSYDLWEILRSPLLAGAAGSKVVVTTRDTDVALTMGSVEWYHLKLLSDDDCWSVFLKHAFENRDIDAYPNLELLHQKVVQKCKGLPLAARALGGLLRSKQRYEDWDDILSSRIWDIPEESGILPILKLSYYHLPSHLKRCFAYCAIFHKDYEFKEKELVLLWMAEGLIQQSRGDKHLEDIGSEYFRNLLSRSLFQLSSVPGSSKFTMHDLVHDLAQWVAGDLCFRLEDELGTNNQPKRFEKARHSSYTCSYYDGEKKFEVFYKAKHLRTFLPVRTGLLDMESHISNTVLSDLLPKLKRLRVLSLVKYNITELPNSIGDLRHLRSLNLSETNIRILPESINLLFNLQILMLARCYFLSKLPSNIENLVSLRHLDISDLSHIGEMPLGIEKLTCLRTLSNFIVGKDAGSSLKDLKNLKLLNGKLCISRLENVTDTQDMTEAILSNNKDLEVLVLEWGPRSRHSDESLNEVAVAEKYLLELLQPQRNLQELTIRFYSGMDFPSWIGNPSFSSMVVLTLEDCEKCTSLPLLGLLGSLKNLTIRRMKSIKSIGSEFCGEGCSKSFQSLETLHFDGLDEWEHWDPIKENKQVEIFPQLRELSISFCPKLSGKLPPYLPLLEKLYIFSCKQLVISFSSLPVLRELSINGCKEMVCRSPITAIMHTSPNISNFPGAVNWLRQGFQKMERLTIVDCEQFMPLLQNVISLQKPTQGLFGFTSLRKLSIGDLPNLISFPDADFLSILNVLEIRNCNALKSLPQGIKHNNTHLGLLRIDGCHNLTVIFRGQIPSSLESLNINNCEKLQLLFDVKDNVNTCSPSSSSSSVVQKESMNSVSTTLLKYLDVYKCPSLTCLSSTDRLPPTVTHLDVWECSSLTTLSRSGQLPTALTRLWIMDCSKLTTLLSSRGQLPKALEVLQIEECPKLESVVDRFQNNTSLDYIVISKCENLKSIPEGLHTLRNLRQIYISDCPSLVSFPESGFPDADLIVSIHNCEKLLALPKRLHRLYSLQELRISQCPCIVSVPEEGFPTNIISLSVDDLNIYKTLIAWGLHKLTSLKELKIGGCPDTESFPQEEKGMILPTTLTRLTTEKFPKLKYLSSKSFQSFTSLECLSLSGCSKLMSLPVLPSSLLQLYIKDCPLLAKQCKRDNGREWIKIAHIPCVWVDYKFVYDPAEEPLQRSYNAKQD